MLYKIFRGCVGMGGQDICFRRDGKYFSPPSNLAGEKVWKNTEAQKQPFSPAITSNVSSMIRRRTEKSI
jgi:hypothetical protein